MFRSFRAAEEEALRPLLDAAVRLSPEDVPVYLDELRRDAPTVAARLETLLARMSVDPAPDPAAAPAPEVPSSPPIRLPAADADGTIATPAGRPAVPRMRVA